MSVRKRTWVSGGEAQDRLDRGLLRPGAGRGCMRTFDRKKDADAYAITVGHEVREGTHVARAEHHRRRGG